MASISDKATEFVRKAQAGEKVTFKVSRAHAALFLSELARHGLEFAADALDNIRDPKLREAVKAIVLAAGTCCVLGASIGAAVAGPAGAPVGAVIGAGVGLVAGCVAVLVVNLGDTDDGYLLVRA